MNKDLKHKMKQYAEQPDAEVWNRIEQKLTARLRWRRVGVVAGVAGLVAGVLIAVLPLQPTPIVVVEAPQVAAEEVAEQLLPVASPVEVADNEVAMSADVPQAMVAAPTVANPKIGQPQPHTTALPTATPKAVQHDKPAATAERASQHVATASQPTAPQPQQHHATTPSEMATTVEAPTTEESTTTAPQQAPSALPSCIAVTKMFSPQSDEEAFRMFKVIPTEQISHFSIYIYNRSGQQVYHSKDITAQWDGTRKGTPLPQGAYVYVASYKDSAGQLHNERGTFVLLR